jgi:hypothetical protein
MSASNEKPEGKNTKAEGQRDEGAPDTSAGNALDMNALGEISGGASSKSARDFRMAQKVHVLIHGHQATPGREGKSGA